MTTWGRLVHGWAAWLFAAATIVQGYLAGQALAQLGGKGDFSTHSFFGYVILGLLGLIVLLGAVVGRMPRSQVGLSVLLFVLYFVQTSLPFARSSAPAIAALHPAVAMLLLVLAAYIGWRARRIGTTDPTI